MHTASIRLLLLFVTVLITRGLAQEAKPADPFVKAKPGAKGAPAAVPGPLNPPGPPPVVPIVPEPLPSNLLFTFETYTLPQDALDAIHLNSPPPQQFYERVRQFVADGKGTLDSLVSLPTRSGQRAASESIDEVLYPTEFDPPVPGRNFAFPTACQMRPTGQRIELDPVLSPDETMVDINVAPEFTRLAGFVLQKADEHGEGQLQPLFSTRKIQNAVTCPINTPTLLGTSSAPKQTGVAEANGDGSLAVTFVVPRLSGPAEAMPLKEPPLSTGTGNLRLVFRFYSLPRGAARDLLAKYTDADSLHTQVRALPPTDWKLERLITVETRSGQRAAVEEIAENIYGTEMDPPHPPRVREKKPATTPPAPAKGEGQAAQATTETPPVYRGSEALHASFTAFEMRPSGWRIEVDPVVGPDGSTVDLNLVPEHTEYLGKLQGPALLARYPEQPVFSCQKVTTAVTTTVGRQCFIGTMNTPHDTGVNGRKDDGRAWFAFVIATLE